MLFVLPLSSKRGAGFDYTHYVGIGTSPRPRGSDLHMDDLHARIWSQGSDAYAPLAFEGQESVLNTVEDRVAGSDLYGLVVFYVAFPVPAIEVVVVDPV